MRRHWKFSFLLLVPLALYAFIAERNSWRPKIIDLGPGYAGIVKFSPDGRYLAISTAYSGVNHDFCIYDFGLRQVLHTFEVAWPIGFPKSDRLALWDYQTAHFCVYSLPDCKLLERRSTLPVGASLEIKLDEAIFSPDGKISALYDSSQHSINLRDTKSGKVTRKIFTRLGLLCGFDFSPDGRTLVSGGDDGTVKLWRIK